MDSRFQACINVAGLVYGAFVIDVSAWNGFPVNRHRLHEPIGYISLAEAEVNYYQQLAEKTVVNI